MAPTSEVPSCSPGQGFNPHLQPLMAKDLSCLQALQPQSTVQGSSPTQGCKSKGPTISFLDEPCNS
ncbi:hypothetical protein E2C01_014202 [Portunus trituberculatus]|uniref:Uncharacterized protein n=1 Tax=Portunus trituberculatus TaxID=210409 RepID=A0A5B7DJS3_PORTR|nr:hypothetical protein [Portunus trituberculatus]